MNIEAKLQVAKEIGHWVHGHTNEIDVPVDRRTLTSFAVFQQTLDLADGIVILLENSLPGVAFALARPLHEGYVRGVWLLEHADENQLDNFINNNCPKLDTLVKMIGDAPETGGHWIKGMNDQNISIFHDLAHGGMEHVNRRISETSIEPGYKEKEIVSLLVARNQYCLNIGIFMLDSIGKQEPLNELDKLLDQWGGALTSQGTRTPKPLRGFGARA